ncbi:hypothetical protein ABEB33_02715 [Herbaspirillum huttiense]|uniref:hypothetical protein n=1 Tax=Herbaspirillum huttiense TaxID=863372 RepID=UPI00387835F1
MHASLSDDQRPFTPSSSTFILYLTVCACVYWIINFVMTPNMLSPLHQDDYLVLGAGSERLSWFLERPVSTNFAAVMGILGPNFSYGVVNVLTVAIPPLVLFFCAQLLRIRIHWLIAIPFSIFCYSHSSAFEHGKYLGLITNLMSHFFGCLVLIAMMYSWQKLSRRMDQVATICYGLSVFSKEDFLLPPLILLAYLALQFRLSNADRDHKDWLKKMAVSLLSVATISVLFSVLIKNPFISGATGQIASDASYGVSFNPSVLLNSFQTLTVEYAYWYSLAALVSFVLLLLTATHRRLEVMVFAVMIVLLALPYTLLANHLFSYRVFAWLPWFAALLAAVIAIHLQGKSLIKPVWLAWPIALLATAIPPWINYLDEVPRLSIAAWYMEATTANRNMLNAIEEHRDLLQRSPAAGIIGLTGLSPWSNNSGSFLKQKLGFQNEWIVFVDQPSMFYRIPLEEDLSSIKVTLTSKICDYPHLPVFKFDQQGHATMLNSDQLCAAKP